MLLQPDAAVLMGNQSPTPPPPHTHTHTHTHTHHLGKHSEWRGWGHRQADTCPDTLGGATTRLAHMPHEHSHVILYCEDIQSRHVQMYRRPCMIAVTALPRSLEVGSLDRGALYY